MTAFLRTHRGLLGLLLVSVLAGAWFLPRLGFDDDEFQHFHFAWLLARGEVPYRDFFEHHLPLYHLLLAPLTLGAPGPERLFLARGLQVCLLTLTMGFLHNALRRWTGSPRAVVPVCLLCLASPFFLCKMVEVRPAGLSLALGVVALCLLAQGPRFRLAGLLTGAMVVSSQKFVFLALPLFLLTATQHGPRATGRFLLGAVVFPLLLLMGLWAGGALGPAWEALVQMNLGWKHRFSPAGYAWQFWSASSLLVVLAVVGILNAPHSRPARAALLLNLSALAALLLVPVPYRQLFLLLYPGLALAAVSAWQNLDALLPRRAGTVLLLALGILPALPQQAELLQHGPQTELALMQELDARTRGPVFDGRGLLFWRPHVGRYAWMHQELLDMLDPAALSTETTNALVRAGLPDLLWDYRVDRFPAQVQAFLRQTYLPDLPAPRHVPGIAVDRPRGTLDLHLPVAGVYHIEWRGGQVWLNEQACSVGQTLRLSAGHHSLRSQGFVRELRIKRVEPLP